MKGDVDGHDRIHCSHHARSIEAPFYDVGLLSERGMFLGLDGISAARRRSTGFSA
jgi:hypothetical protein